MFYLFIFILIIILFPVLVIGARILHLFFRILSPFRKMYKQAKREERESQSSDFDTTKTDRKKIFSSNEGEYVDFEEVGQ
jgi:predicted Holliday junction resolvase-like endonuclease